MADRFANCRLIFCDASVKRRGGLAAVVFPSAEGEPLISTRTLPVTGSNELELQAALFGLQQAQLHFPGELVALFSDNRDAVDRLGRAKSLGLAQDPALAAMLEALGIAAILDHATPYWVRAHATCRGNALADQHASAAAGPLPDRPRSAHRSSCPERPGS
ncbi:MAG: ribonuclease HI [Betaproteobacteria bacterium]